MVPPVGDPRCGWCSSASRCGCRRRGARSTDSASSRRCSARSCCFAALRGYGCCCSRSHLTLPMPSWQEGTVWLLLGFVAVNLLILMEVADRLSLKGDLEIARDIQLAMLPGGVKTAGDATVCGVTRPANTVGGDFYDIIPLADGRLVLAIGDVAGKGSPAALLMALLLAMLRTLVDEGLETGRLIERLNAQVGKHSPASRFITFFFGLYDPATGAAAVRQRGASATAHQASRRALRANHRRHRQRPRAGHVRGGEVRNEPDHHRGRRRARDVHGWDHGGRKPLRAGVRGCGPRVRADARSGRRIRCRSAAAFSKRSSAMRVTCASPTT